MDRVFQCPQCDKCFKEIRTLKLHLKIHNSEYPEQCPVCQKVFRTKWQLKQHQMDHGGERPYPCPECTFTCKTKQQLTEHRRKHSGEKAYSCSLCGTRFTYRNGLIKHTKLNRCPKRNFSIEGETRTKKQSRHLSMKNSKTPPGHFSFLSETYENPEWGESGNNQQSSPTSLTNLADNRKREDLVSSPSCMKKASSETLPSITAAHSTRKIETSHQAIVAGGLPHSIVSELSLATGLPESQIRSWASCLPTGSTVKVTHHFDNSILAKGVNPKPITSAHWSNPVLKVNYSTTGVCHYQPQHSDIQVPENLLNTAVGITPYQESSAIDPNKIPKKDFSTLTYIYPTQNAVSISNSDNTKKLKVLPLLNVRVIRSESPRLTNISEDFSLSSTEEIKRAHPFLNHICSSSRNSPSTKTPAMIHSANSRLLTCSSLLQKLDIKFEHDSMEESSSFHSSTPSHCKRETQTLPINAIFEPIHSPVEPSSPEGSICHYATSLISPQSTASASGPSSVGSWSLNSLLPDCDIDLPDLCDDSDPSGLSINDQDLMSIKEILDQTFKNGRDVFDLISTVY